MYFFVNLIAILTLGVIIVGTYRFSIWFWNMVGKAFKKVVSVFSRKRKKVVKGEDAQIDSVLPVPSSEWLE